MGGRGERQRVATLPKNLNLPDSSSIRFKVKYYSFKFKFFPLELKHFTESLSKGNEYFSSGSDF